MTISISGLPRITTLLMLIATLPGTVLAGPTVVLISGTGYEPDTLERGNEVSAKSWVSADENTIIVLADSWRVDANKTCQQYVIIRKERYRVPSKTPGDCEKTGSGDELAKAMQGEPTLATVQALWFGSAKADNPAPDNFEQLNEDLHSLNRQVQLQSQNLVPPATITVVPGAAAKIATPPPAYVDQQQPGIDEERRPQLRAQQRAEREAEMKRENAEREATAQREAKKLEAARKAGLNDSANPESVCVNTMRPSLVEHESGMSWWNPQKVRRLCGGTRVGDQPRKCFSVVMSGRMETSGLHTWNMDQALELCRGTSDAKRTIGCFSQLYKNKVAIELAINACGSEG